MIAQIEGTSKREWQTPLVIVSEIETGTLAGTSLSNTENFFDPITMLDGGS